MVFLIVNRGKYSEKYSSKQIYKNPQSTELQLFGLWSLRELGVESQTQEPRPLDKMQWLCSQEGGIKKNRENS